MINRLPGVYLKRTSLNVYEADIFNPFYPAPTPLSGRPHARSTVTSCWRLQQRGKLRHSLDVDSNRNRGAGHPMSVMRVELPLRKEIPYARRHLTESG
jgi:hypothetical protein